MFQSVDCPFVPTPLPFGYADSVAAAEKVGSSLTGPLRHFANVRLRSVPRALPDRPIDRSIPAPFRLAALPSPQSASRRQKANPTRVFLAPSTPDITSTTS